MKAILIDDEKLALTYLEKQLQDLGVEVIGSYQDPYDGKNAILNEDVDVGFFDIQIANINGIEIAEKVMELKPKLEIVFVTGYDNYAIKAFEMNALDYVLKPITKTRLSKTIKRIQSRIDNLNHHNHSTPPSSIIQVNLLGSVYIGTETNSYTPLQWRTVKAQELFIYLIQQKDQLVRKDELIDLLWPDSNLEKANALLYTTVYNIRKAIEPLRDFFTLKKVTGGYILTTNQVVVDVDEWKQNMKNLPTLSSSTVTFWEECLEQYKGDYLMEFDYWWAEGERYRLKQLWIRKSMYLANWYQKVDHDERAIQVYNAIIELDIQNEDAYFELMKIYAKQQDGIAVDECYSSLQESLQLEIGSEPNEQIKLWYSQWNKELT